MLNTKNVAGEVVINVKARLDVDDDTFNTCMSLITIRAKADGLKGMLVKFDNSDSGYYAVPIMDEDNLDAANRVLM